MSIAALATSAVPAVFELLKSLIPSLATTTSTGIIGSAIGVITEYAPLVMKEYAALKPIVVDTIEAIRANPNTMPEQLEKLKAAAKLYDAEWADALEKSRAGDKAAGY